MLSRLAAIRGQRIPDHDNTMHALTELQVRKFTTLFRYYDRSNDACLSQQDYLAIAKAIAQAFEWQQRAPHFYQTRLAALEQHLQQNFLRLQAASDKNQDGIITLPEFLSYMQRQAMECKSMGIASPWIKDATRQLILLIDQQVSNSLSLDEYSRMLHAFGARVDAASVFARLDHDGDGELKLADLNRLGLEFMTSNDPEAAGNLLYCGQI